jgi:hypothetical protein
LRVETSDHPGSRHAQQRDAAHAEEPAIYVAEASAPLRGSKDPSRDGRADVPEPLAGG